MSMPESDPSTNPFVRDSLLHSQESARRIRVPETAPVLSDEELERRKQLAEAKLLSTPAVGGNFPIEQVLQLFSTSLAPQIPTRERHVAPTTTPNSLLGVPRPGPGQIAPPYTAHALSAEPADSSRHFAHDVASRAANIFWGGSKKRRAGTLILASTIILGGVSELTNTTAADAVAMVKGRIGGAANDVVYNAPDCTNPSMKPQFYNNEVTSMGNLILRQVVFRTPDERKKMAANKAYQPQEVSSLFEQNLSVQQRSLSQTPFTNKTPLVLRLPDTIFDGRVGFNVCFTDIVKHVIQQQSGDNYNATIDLSKIAVIPTTDDPQLKLAYERGILTVKPGQDSNSPYPDGELKRQTDLVMPNPKDPAVMNPAILADIKVNALNIFNAGAGCDTWLTKNTKDTLQTLVDTDAGHHVTISWDNGIVSPAATYAHSTEAKALTGKAMADFKVINLDTKSPTCDSTSNEGNK